MIENKCDKEPYQTRPEVVSAMNGLAKRGVKKLRSYQCDDCGLWHITSIKPHTKRKYGKVKFMAEAKRDDKKFIPIKVSDQEIKAGQQKKETPTKFKDIFN